MEDQLSQVRAIAERITRSFGLDVFDAQLRRESLGWVLRIFIDRVPTGDNSIEDRVTESVTVDDCQRVSRDVSIILDAEFSFKHPYTLEVSSPGLDRPLRHVSDCARFTGFLARFVLSEAVEGRNFVSGSIKGTEELSEASGNGRTEHIIVDSGRQLHRIPWALVTRARLEIEL